MAHQQSTSPTYRTVDDGQSWSPGWIARLPWLGFTALLGSILAIAASVGILVASNGRPISDWRVQPTVWLAVVSTASNIMLHYALTKGATISWWRRAMRPRTQLDDLHREWLFGNSLWSAATATRHVNILAIATVITAMAQINNPLLQRASRVVSSHTEVVTPVSLKVPVAQDIPHGYTGYISGRAYTASLFTSNYTKTVRDYYNNAAIQLADKSGCEGTCKAKLMGVGLSVNCSSYSWPFDLRFNGVTGSSTANGTNVFQSLFTWQVASGNMSLNIQYKDQSPCVGDLVVKNCTMHTALVSYPIVINSNNTIFLDPQTSVFDDAVSQRIDIDSDIAEAGPSTLSGYYLALKNKFNSEAHLRYAGAVGYELITTGSTSTQYAVTNKSTGSDSETAASCGLTFSDPTLDLIASARELMFRTALGIAIGNSSLLQTVIGLQTTSPTVYASQYLYLAIAVVLTGVAVLLVSFTFLGYSTLGRDVSMSPLETAKAFSAPLLENANSNADVDTLVQTVGEKSVRYGAVSDAVAARSGTTYAVHKTGTQETSSQVDVRRLRLKMGDEGIVRTPEKGWKFVE